MEVATALKLQIQQLLEMDYDMRDGEVPSDEPARARTIVDQVELGRIYGDALLVVMSDGSLLEVVVRKVG